MLKEEMSIINNGNYNMSKNEKRMKSIDEKEEKKYNIVSSIRSNTPKQKLIKSKKA